MRVFLCGVDSGLGFAIAQRLLAEGHSVSAVTHFDVRSWRSSGVKAILGEIADPTAHWTDTGHRDCRRLSRLFRFGLDHRRDALYHQRPALIR